jgi:hypothetical protein
MTNMGSQAKLEQELQELCRDKGPALRPSNFSLSPPHRMWGPHFIWQEEVLVSESRVMRLVSGKGQVWPWPWFHTCQRGRTISRTERLCSLPKSPPDTRVLSTEAGAGCNCSQMSSDKISYWKRQHCPLYLRRWTAFAGLCFILCGGELATTHGSPNPNSVHSTEKNKYQELSTPWILRFHPVLRVEI